MTFFPSRSLLRTSTLVAMVAVWMSLPTADAAVIGFFNAPGVEQSIDLFDNFWIARMESQGHTVIRAGQNTEFNDAVFDDVELFIISDDVTSTNIGNVIDSTGLLDTRPVIMYESGAMDNYKIGDGEAYSRQVQTDVDLRDVVINDPGSPLAGGLSGTVRVINSGPGFGPKRLHGVRAGDGIALAPGLQTVATSVPSSDENPFFVPFVDGSFVPSDTITTLGFVPQGGELNDGTLAAGLRIITFFDDESNPDTFPFFMTADAITLVDAALNFGLGLPVGPSADFDGDNDVDGNDFLVWQRGFGTTYNANDLTNWQSEFGATPSGAIANAVPEPASWLLASLMTVAIGVWRRPS